MKLRKALAFMAMLMIVVVISNCKKDDPGVRPTVASTDPADNTKGVALNKVIIATFSVSMDASSINATTFLLKQGTAAVTGTVVSSGLTASFTPSGTLTANTVYTATITTGVKNTSGTTLAANTTFSFTTGDAPDTILPTVSLTDPLNNVTDVARNKVIAVTFSEAMNPLTINSSTFTLKQGSTSVTGTVGYSGTIATFTPATSLTAAADYTATISTGAQDLAGNALAANKVWSFSTGGTTATLAFVDLKASGNYVILAKTAINNSSTSAVTGDLGLSPAAESYITGLSLSDATGYATSAQVTGKVYAADQADPTPINLTTAVNNMVSAYNDAAGRPSPDFSELGTGNIGGKTLSPGLYKWTSVVTVPASITLSGGANDVWIFQIAGDLTVSNAVNVTLTGGAQAKNIFWQVAGKATLGTTSHFAGVIMSMTSITLQTGAVMNGRALAQTAVILDSNTVTNP